MNIDIGSARKMILGGMALISVFGLVYVSKKACSRAGFPQGLHGYTKHFDR
ncbi:TPA: hypothetical protein QHZ98_000012 [Klebsiella oxytoca]|nr:hypothetical protein [Klebsiella oxytoca]